MKKWVTFLIVMSLAVSIFAVQGQLSKRQSTLFQRESVKSSVSDKEIESKRNARLEKLKAAALLNGKQQDKKNPVVEFKRILPDKQNLRKGRAVTSPAYTPQKALATGNARVILKVADPWGDGTGYQMLLDSNATAYDNANQPDYYYPFTYPYSNFAYKIPENADDSPATQNKVVNDAIGIDIPAGTYDFFIVNPYIYAGAVAGLDHLPGDYDRGDNFIFEANKIYEFEVILVNYVEHVNLTITNNSPTVPAAPTGFTVTPDAGGALSAVLSWTNPAVDASGNTLSSITSITVKRDGTVIDTYSSLLTPGAAATYTDNTPTNGDHTYSIYASNADGDGVAVSATVFIGTAQQNGTARVILKVADPWGD
ncbi:MAG: DUF2436 domain-containing protein [Dysgonamonadaceae bacterium]|jgi:hypothetical protein|nr:DUF2436 domain-containing protein [Dysgonamonadaceae bacterium]